MFHNKIQCKKVTQETFKNISQVKTVIQWTN